MIDIHMTTDPGKGTSDPAEIATATVDGHDYTARSRSSGISALARTLVEAGTPDQPWQATNAAGMPCLRGPSLHGLARRTITESDKGGLRVGKYTPFAAARGAQGRGQ
jgi:hypothetical protein